jgi:hypothetical protein
MDLNEWNARRCSKIKELRETKHKIRVSSKLPYSAFEPAGWAFKSPQGQNEILFPAFSLSSKHAKITNTHA